MIHQLARAFEGQTLDGRYLLASLLGAGGFGCVFKADHLVPKRSLAEVAVKIVLQKADRSDTQLQELKAAVDFSHPHLVRCYSAGDATLALGSQSIPVYYVVMELATRTLADELNRGLMGAGEVQRVGVDVAGALAYLAERGTVHRDVKPSNILRVGNQWKLSDLGIVRHLEDGATADSAPIGCWPYMPPEAHRGVVSPMWDVWSLGVTLMQALTNQLPFTMGPLGE